MSYVVVYVDGCCLSNGRGLGYGIWFQDDEDRYDYGPLPFAHHTNQRAELYAILRALEMTKDDEASLLLRTDWQYAINQSEGTQRTYTNRDQVRKIQYLIEERNWPVKFEHVSGNSGNYGNKKADEFANMGARSATIHNYDSDDSD